MKKYRVDYKLMGIGNFFVEASSLNLAYEEMYKRFSADNSLIVHAKYPYGFEILDGTEHESPFPAVSKIRLTTIDDLRKAKNSQSLDDEADKPPRFADTGLFDFVEKSNTETT
ncbi:hypothetical protein [Limnohabitans sp. Jir72]|uniref:hypothetical protein n=1 Tax=Limnohabitans sp. Jir72 TaxID=1977909 RepID=UPI000D34A89C|nr:hypothetical protein [Limnohabitans sp. Jir72]PUE23716.1 hypothetical protein B9Z52_17300 [Limnohabitans sp. Jir72]